MAALVAEQTQRPSSYQNRLSSLLACPSYLLRPCGHLLLLFAMLVPLAAQSDWQWGWRALGGQGRLRVTAPAAATPVAWSPPWRGIAEDVARLPHGKLVQELHRGETATFRRAATGRLWPALQALLRAAGPWEGRWRAAAGEAASAGTASGGAAAWTRPIDPAIWRRRDPEAVLLLAGGWHPAGLPERARARLIAAIEAASDEQLGSTRAAELLDGSGGTWLASVASGMLLPRIQLAVPRSPALDAWIVSEPATRRWRIVHEPGEGPLRLVLNDWQWPLRLDRDDTHWVLSSESALWQQWQAGTAAGDALDPDGVFFCRAEARSLAALLVSSIAAAAPLVDDQGQLARSQAAAMAWNAPAGELRWQWRATAGGVRLQSRGWPAEPLLVSVLAAQWLDRWPADWAFSGEQLAAARLRQAWRVAREARLVGERDPDGDGVPAYPDATELWPLLGEAWATATGSGLDGYRFAAWRPQDPALQDKHLLLAAWPVEHGTDGRLCLVLGEDGLLRGRDIGEREPEWHSPRTRSDWSAELVWPVIGQPAPWPHRMER